MGVRTKVKNGRMVELLPGLSVLGAMILLGGLFLLSGCTSTGQWSAEMVVPKMKGAFDTRRFVPLESPPRIVNGWECNNEPLFFQPGGNAFVSTGILRSLRKNFSSRAKGLLKASGDWTVTDYGLWNMTCVRYKGIVATVLPPTPVNRKKVVLTKKVAPSPVSKGQPSSPVLTVSAPLRHPTLETPALSAARASVALVPRIEPWMAGPPLERTYHGYRTEPPRPQPLAQSSAPSLPPSVARSGGESHQTPQRMLSPGMTSTASSPQAVTVPRIEPWMAEPAQERLYHHYLEASARVEKAPVPKSPTPGATGKTPQKAAPKRRTSARKAPGKISMPPSPQAAPVPRIEPWMAEPAPERLYHHYLEASAPVEKAPAPKSPTPDATGKTPQKTAPKRRTSPRKAPGKISTAPSPQAVTVPRIEPWMIAPADEGTSHGGLP